MHFFWIYHWMKQMGIQAGEMDMVFDCEDLDTCIGSFGVGLAQGLMQNVWTLPTLQASLADLCIACFFAVDPMHTRVKTGFRAACGWYDDAAWRAMSKRE